MKTDPTFWIAARASGLVAYIALTSSVVAGLVLKSRPLGSRVRPAAVTDVHRFLALVGLAAIGMHGVALVLDTSVPLSWLALVVPGRASYRPLATALGVLAAETMLVVYLSFAARKLIGVANWRRLHWATYAIFAAATAHGLLAGSDSNHRWAFSLYTGSIAVVAFATCWRALVPPPRPQRKARDTAPA